VLPNVSRSGLYACRSRCMPGSERVSVISRFQLCSSSSSHWLHTAAAAAAASVLVSFIFFSYRRLYVQEGVWAWGLGWDGVAG